MRLLTISDWRLKTVVAPIEIGGELTIGGHVDQVVWTQWDDLKAPDEFKRLSPASTPLDGENLGEITFFAPPYMGGRNALLPILRMPKLKIVQLPNAGYDDALEFLRPGLTLCNARGVHDASTAELAVGLAIASLRGFPKFLRNQFRGVKWTPDIGRFLKMWALTHPGGASARKKKQI
jgi:lactate dehydrogenase-like 2-hydroxyacid dehydrogenase